MWMKLPCKVSAVNIRVVLEDWIGIIHTHNC